MMMTVDTDLALRPSPEAEICLNCNKKKCKTDCERFITKLNELREKERQGVKK